MRRKSPTHVHLGSPSPVLIISALDTRQFTTLTLNTCADTKKAHTHALMHMSEWTRIEPRAYFSNRVILPLKSTLLCKAYINRGMLLYTQRKSLPYKRSTYRYKHQRHKVPQHPKTVQPVKKATTPPKQCMHVKKALASCFMYMYNDQTRRRVPGLDYIWTQSWEHKIEDYQWTHTHNLPHYACTVKSTQTKRVNSMFGKVPSPLGPSWYAQLMHVCCAKTERVGSTGM